MVSTFFNLENQPSWCSEHHMLSVPICLFFCLFITATSLLWGSPDYCYQQFHKRYADRQCKGISILQKQSWLFTETKVSGDAMIKLALRASTYKQTSLLPYKITSSCPTLEDSMQAVLFKNGGVQKAWCKLFPAWGGFNLLSLDLNQLLWYPVPWLGPWRWLRVHTDPRQS